MAGETPYRPQLWWQLAFNADPNDLTGVPIWNDYTSLVRKVTANKRGRQYELAQSQAAEPILAWRDPNEIFNPANTGSAQYPNVEPYRQVLGQAMWPNPPVAGQPNLINSGRWKANNAVAPDPSFESYTNGAALPGWLTAVGATVPTITTTNPQQGTKSLTYTVASSSTQQGVSWEADCVPGQQYTTSAYVRQSTGSTQRLTIGGQTLLYDYFTRSASSSWGTSTSGASWTNTGGSASDFSVSSNKGNHSNASTNVLRTSLADSGGDNVNVVVYTVLPVTPTGAAINRWLVGRCTDTSNYYSARLGVSTSGVVTLGLFKLVAAASTQIVSDVTLGVMTPGDAWGIRLEVTGTTVRARAWSSGTLEPATWQASVTDTSLTTGTNVGVITRCETGNTNGTVVTTWDNLMCTGTLASSTTTTTGSYVRLSKTFTATQPKHTITVATLGAATAGTVNVDAIQHEIGASATSFSTSGPVIYPLMRNYIERWPREYDAAGFVGYAVTPAVDGFAALNATNIPTELVSATLALGPQYFYPLAGTQVIQVSQTSSFNAQLDQSGNGGPPLLEMVSLYGAGTAPQYGSGISILGDPGATGVKFTPDGASIFNQQCTILGCGKVINNTPGISWPGFLSGAAVTPTDWGVTVSCVFKADSAPSPAQDVTLVWAWNPSSPAGQEKSPAWLTITSAGFVQGSCFTPAGATVIQDNTVNYFTDTADFHLATMTWRQVSGGNTTIKLYVDGSLKNSATLSTASNLLTADCSVLQVGGLFDAAAARGGVFPGAIAHVALWNRELSASEIATLGSASLGYTLSNETSGVQLARHLSNGRYAGATRVSAGSTVMSAPTQSGLIDLLSDGQAHAVAEMGTLWVAPDGALVFEGRQDRWLRLTSVATLGENTAGGEVPYLDGVLFDYDPTFVYANVRITRNNGSVARGGNMADINTANRKFFGRSFAIGADFQTDTIAQYYADYVFNTHKATVQRVSRITIDPASNPSLWPTALSLEIGQRVTVKRRPKAANSGAGITMSADYFIESVEHGEIDMGRGGWTVSFLLSPIGSVGSGSGISFQPWILEDTTYGVLDSTTILGW